MPIGPARESHARRLSRLNGELGSQASRRGHEEAGFGTMEYHGQMVDPPEKLTPVGFGQPHELSSERRPQM